MFNLPHHIGSRVVPYRKNIVSNVLQRDGFILITAYKARGARRRAMIS